MDHEDVLRYGINAMILYNLNLSRSENVHDRMVRRKFLQNLGHILIEPFLKIRKNNPKLRTYIKTAINEILSDSLGEDDEGRDSDDEESSLSSTPSTSYTRQKSEENPGSQCYICLQNGIRRKKVANCDLCKRGFCRQHQITRCIPCSHKQ